MTRSVDVRRELSEALRLDLVGPGPDDEHAGEALAEPPSSWYLTGFLVPYEAEEDVRRGDGVDEQLEVAEPGGLDDADDGERASARRTYFASSIGLSVLLPPGTESLVATVTWGDYLPEKPPRGVQTRSGRLWRRVQRTEKVTLVLGADGSSPDKEVPDSGGLHLVTSGRVLTSDGPLRDHLSVSVFLVNHRPAAAKQVKDQAFVFQAGFTLSYEAGFVARPDPRGFTIRDDDERVADLHYRDVGEYAVGHGVASKADTEKGVCRQLSTRWIPESEVPRVVPAHVEGVEIGMEALAELDDVAPRLEPLVTAYGDWLKAREEEAGSDSGLSARRREVARHLHDRAEVARGRMAEGIAALSDPVVLEAFHVTNRAMARAARQLHPERYEEGKAPSWRLFQLAFLLMNLKAMDLQDDGPPHGDRGVVDLIFFPTGGGKTEAYLGLAAYTLVLRRLRNPGIGSAGVAVLMRYTLRLLTLDQLSRAAALVCALELERVDRPERLGDWPFEIGLWVGSAATPNRMGRLGDNKKGTARQLTIAYGNDTTKPPPIPLAQCPWCGSAFSKHSFKLVDARGEVDTANPADLWVRCVNRSCDFSPRKRGRLPIVTVDEPIYRRLPAFLIATVDKFASLPWTGATGALFGQVDRHDGAGFYGPCDPPRVGSPLPGGRLAPPDLIIQDELHLISGPLGTMAGLYETVIDRLSVRRTASGHEVRPKIVASTATVRRAESQIRALFARSRVDVFPPPGPDRRDSFFAHTIAVTPEEPGRLYLGVAAPGRSLKVVLLRAYVALLSAAQALYERGERDAKNPADPYMTLVGYFSSLKELGGSRRLVEDEVRAKAGRYAERLRRGETRGRYADRRLRIDVSELTSRESTDRVSATKDRLGRPHSADDSIDVALATNMISVGLDIDRLGLMVVLGQPKTTAEYIQSTSRVGRDAGRPGLVVTLMNVHRPRDRSHYERFGFYHETFYRAVEATSVTPFSRRAVDRGLAAVTVALARHGLTAMTPPRAARSIGAHLGELGFVGETLRERYRDHRTWLEAEADEMRARAESLRGQAAGLLDDWETVASKKDEGKLQYQPWEVTGALPLLYTRLEPKPSPSYPFVADRSLRDVEPSVNLWLRWPDGDEEDES